MALILIIVGSFIGLVVALLKCIVMDASLTDGLISYFAFALGLPVTVGLAKWIQGKLRGVFHSAPVLRIKQTDN